MDFQNIYMQLTKIYSWDTYLKNNFQEWNAMFSTVNNTLNMNVHVSYAGHLTDMIGQTNYT